RNLPADAINRQQPQGKKDLAAQLRDGEDDLHLLRQDTEEELADPQVQFAERWDDPKQPAIKQDGGQTDQNDFLNVRHGKANTNGGETRQAPPRSLVRRLTAKDLTGNGRTMTRLLCLRLH